VDVFQISPSSHRSTRTLALPRLRSRSLFPGGDSSPVRPETGSGLAAQGQSAVRNSGGFAPGRPEQVKLSLDRKRRAPRLDSSPCAHETHPPSLRRPAPELNEVEYFWCHSSRAEMAQPGGENLIAVRTQARKAACRVRRRPGLGKAFLKHSSLLRSEHCHQVLQTPAHYICVSTDAYRRAVAPDSRGLARNGRSGAPSLISADVTTRLRHADPLIRGCTRLSTQPLPARQRPGGSPRAC